MNNTAITSTRRDRFFAINEKKRINVRIKKGSSRRRRQIGRATNQMINKAFGW